jgi:hypothetical protein
MSGKRGDRVTPPGRPGGWEARYANTAAAKGWEELCQAAKSSTWEAFVVLTERPDNPENTSRQHRLRGSLATFEVRGKILDQWQYEVTGSGRIWYCPDPEARIVWVVHASPRHPKATE